MENAMNFSRLNDEIAELDGRYNTHIMIRIRNGFTGDTHVHEICAVEKHKMQDGTEVITINAETEPTEEVS